ncbi:beta-propeller domain-containing protein [Accumulibacter sp.]|uniref:beta-propeller domain-containing protein n=1 Tax=Accumulibacter sp. TaxID=2053492 RepID=UPI00262BAF89|nr:beta-propeller domain-containing protein [Accumulibacter sp.]
MNRTLVARLTAVVLGVLCLPPALAAEPLKATAPRKTLSAFASEQELADLFKRWADEAQRRRDEQQRARADKSANSAVGQFALPSPAPSAAAPAAAKEVAKEAVGGKAESVTNVQHAGVDEGGIVKLHGDHLVILRRGRLFTVRIGGEELRPVAAIDAFGTGIDPGGAWYDEMLISGNTIVVIGYSYARGGTEVGVFDISRDGQLAYRASYHLRSNDYYSSRNYASRLIGDKLIVYSPHFLSPWSDPWAAFPALRRWRPGALPADFRRIAPATRIYRTDEALDPFAGVALHSVTICDLAKPEMDCQSSAVLGPPGRVFYVSPNSVFVWTTAGRAGSAGTVPASAVFRIPLDGSAPSMLKTVGSPIDQFSFLEDEDGMLNVLLRANGRGEGMWAAEAKAGDLALLRVPLASFSDGRDGAPGSAYRRLPEAPGHALQSRYVGPYLLYGAGRGWQAPSATTSSQVYAVRYAQGEVYELPLAHSVDRLEALGRNALVVGSSGKDLHLTSVRLSSLPVTAGRYTRPDAAQGETRSHGFFYKSDGDFDGLLGLPIVGAGESAARQLRTPSAALLFLRNRALSLSELGTLKAQPSASDRNDGCRASCVDWYGNSRPLFVRGRVFALMGYEIVEGKVDDKRIVETRRISFAPAVLQVTRE